MQFFKAKLANFDAYDAERLSKSSKCYNDIINTNSQKHLS